MQKLILLSILGISAVLGTTIAAWSQLAYVQATSNESGTIQCITTPCEFPSSQPMPVPPDSESNNDTITTPKKEVELPTEGQNGTNQYEPCISPCPPGSEVCIQMCQPTGQPNVPIEETKSPNDPQQETTLSSPSDTSLSGTMTSDQPTVEDGAETTDSESSESSEFAPTSN